MDTKEVTFQAERIKKYNEALEQLAELRECGHRLSIISGNKSEVRPVTEITLELESPLYEAANISSVHNGSRTIPLVGVTDVQFRDFLSPIIEKQIAELTKKIEEI